MPGIGRTEGESITLICPVTGRKTTVTVMKIARGKVVLNFDAPQGTGVWRSEILDTTRLPALESKAEGHSPPQ